MSALKPCPFCGGEKISTSHIRDGRSCGCTACGASARAYQPDAEQKCQDLWNARAPIDMVLFCPACGDRHIDRADPAPVIMPDGTERTWHNPPHASHLCLKCGHIWRPADLPTNGIEKVATAGHRDSPIVSPVSLQAQLDATNEGAWEYERQLNAALKSLQEIADMHVGDQPAAIDIPEIDWVKRHVGIMRHIASTAGQDHRG